MAGLVHFLVARHAVRRQQLTSFCMEATAAGPAQQQDAEQHHPPAAADGGDVRPPVLHPSAGAGTPPPTASPQGQPAAAHPFPAVAGQPQGAEALGLQPALVPVPPPEPPAPLSGGPPVQEHDRGPAPALATLPVQPLGLDAATAAALSSVMQQQQGSAALVWQQQPHAATWTAVGSLMGGGALQALPQAAPQPQPGAGGGAAPRRELAPAPVPVRRTVYSSVESLGGNVQLASPEVGIVKHRSKKVRRAVACQPGGRRGRCALARGLCRHRASQSTTPLPRLAPLVAAARHHPAEPAAPHPHPPHLPPGALQRAARAAERHQGPGQSPRLAAPQHRPSLHLPPDAAPPLLAFAPLLNARRLTPTARWIPTWWRPRWPTTRCAPLRPPPP